MIGGYFDGHPWGEFDAPLVVEDSGFPGMEHLPRNFTLKDEIYQIKDFSRDNVRVLLRLDASKVDLSRKGVHRKDKDFAVIWARNYGKGRVLYNGLGHRQDVWERPDIQKMWLDMVQWSMGDLPAMPLPDQRGSSLLGHTARFAFGCSSGHKPEASEGCRDSFARARLVSTATHVRKMHKARVPGHGQMASTSAGLLNRNGHSRPWHSDVDVSGVDEIAANLQESAVYLSALIFRGAPAPSSTKAIVSRHNFETWRKAANWTA